MAVEKKKVGSKAMVETKRADAKSKAKKSTAEKSAAGAPARPAPRGKLFYVKRSGVHGRGGFAAQNLPRGTRVAEYVGEIIPWKEVWRRYPDDEEGEEGAQNHTFLFEIDDKRVIDANHGGNSSRWINHSCAPNCIVVGEGDRIFIETRRPIKVDEELNYDYNIQLEERHTPAMKQRYLCRCGARNCRGTILAKKR